MNSPKNLAQYSGNTSSKIFSCIRASANTGPSCIRAKINSPRFFPACIGFVPGGNIKAFWILEGFKMQLLWTQVLGFANKQKIRKTLKIKKMEIFEKYRKHKPPKREKSRNCKFLEFFFWGGGNLSIYCVWKCSRQRFGFFRTQSCFGGRGNCPALVVLFGATFMCGIFQAALVLNVLMSPSPGFLHTTPFVVHRYPVFRTLSCFMYNILLFVHYPIFVHYSVFRTLFLFFFRTLFL